MKQYLSRQLWMLAILLFAGVGNAFAQTNTISVDWDNTVASVDFWNQDGDWQMPSEKEWALVSGNGKNYQMEVYLYNPMVYSINSVKIDGTEIIDSKFNLYDWGGAYMFEDLSADHNVKILFDKVANTNTITVNYDGEKTDYVEFFDPVNSRYLGTGNGVATELPSGSTIRLNINPRQGWRVKTLTVDGEGVAYNGSYYEFTNLSANHTVNIEYEAVATYTITVANYSEVANILDGIWINGNSIWNNNTSVVFNEGTNATMTISCPNNLYSVSIVDNNGNPIPLNRNQNGLYEYVFDNGSLNGDHSVSIVLTKAATNTITVTGGGNNVDVAIRENVSENSWSWINPASSGVWELLSGEGTKYRMWIDIQNYWVYDLGSVTLDGTTDITNSFTQSRAACFRPAIC